MPSNPGSSQSYYSGQRRHSRQRKMSRSISFSAIDSPGGGGVSTEEPSHHVGLCSSSPPVAPRHQHLHLHQQQHHYHHHHPNTQRIPLVNSPDLQLRFLSPSDLPEVKRLCKEWFPIDYPDAWYNDITSNAKFYAVACVYHNRIIGLVVSEIKDYFKLPKEDSELLATTFRRGTQIGYILSLGVVKDFRKNGIASFMLDTLVAHLTSGDNCDVRAIYLHVLTTNSQAIRFYEKRGFKAHLFLPYYYNIKGKRKDGFTYVRYINGGYQPWSVFDYVLHCCQIVTLINPYTLTRFVFRKVNNFTWYRAIPRLRQIAQSSTAVFS